MTEAKENVIARHAAPRQSTPTVTVTSAHLLDLIAAGESQTQEFKASFDKACIESLVAFANTQGGTVLVGVTDAGRVQGVTLGKETLNEWLGQIKSATSPSLIPDLIALSTDGKTVVSIHVAEFPVKPVSTRGRYYKRVASSNHALSPNEIADLYLQSLQISWDAHPAPQASLVNLSPAKIERFIRSVNDSGRFALDADTPLAALEKLNYIVNGHPTWAAMLLFAEVPLRHHIHIGRFKTPSTIIDDRQFTDTLFEAADQAMKFIVSHISVAFEFDGGIQRRERFAYPLPALREALLNAIVHRDYTSGSDIQIKIFDDSISFYSPGRLYGGLRVQDLLSDNYPSRLRNKLVAEAFYLTSNIEKYGSGFIRIRKALQDYPEIRLDIEEIGGGLQLSFRQVRVLQPESAHEGEGVTEGVTKGVTEGVNALISLIRKQPGLRVPALAEQLRTSPKNVERWLRQLRSAGQIEFRGAAKTGGYYPKGA